MYVVVSVSGFLVNCGDQLIVLDLGGSIQKIDLI